MSFFDDIHHMRLAQESIAESMKFLVESGKDINASLKKLVGFLPPDPVVGIEVVPGNPTNH